MAYTFVRTGSPSSLSSVASWGLRPAARAIDRSGAFRRRISTGDSSPVVTRPSVSAVFSAYRSCGFGYGSGRSSAALTVLKMAVVAPTPSARVAMAARAKAGDLRRLRTAKRRSWRSMAGLPPGLAFRPQRVQSSYYERFAGPVLADWKSASGAGDDVSGVFPRPNSRGQAQPPVP